MNAPKDFAEQLASALGRNVWWPGGEKAIERRDAEWRRLVEEAQQRSATWQHNHEDALKAADEARADAKSAIDALGDLNAGCVELEAERDRLKGDYEREKSEHIACAAELRSVHADNDRLKGELAASRLRSDALESLIDTERQSRKETENTLFFVRKDLQKTKGELAEARRLLLEAPVRNNPAVFFMRWQDERDAFLAATPAEPTQPTYDDGEGRPAPQFNTERLISASPIKAAMHAPSFAQLVERAGSLPTTGLAGSAEQAQGDGAKTCECKSAKGLLCAFCQGSADNDARSSMWPTIHGLEQHYREVRAQVAALAKRVGALEEWARRQVAEPWFDPERKPAPPSPGVAGPGHAFINDGKRRCDVHRDGEKCGLPPWEAIHAVPPEAARTGQPCRACGKSLLAENSQIADGCPCNSGRGINHGLVARHTCTCKLCDPAQTGGTRKAPPPSDAAGSGHAFVCRVSKHGKHTEGPCSDVCPCTCGLPRAALVHYSTSGPIATSLRCGHGSHRGSPIYCNDPTGLCMFAAFGPRRTIPKEGPPNCTFCSGTGRVHGEHCVACAGKGYPGDPVKNDCPLISCRQPGCRGEQDHVTGCADNTDHAGPPIPGGK